MTFDDTYDGPRWTYGLSYRPLAYASVPAGWIIGSNRPHPAYHFGTVQYPRELTAAELDAFELQPVSEATVCERDGHDWFDGVASRFCLRPGCSTAEPTPRYLEKTAPP